MEALPKDKKIILFDGVCNLCDSSVQFLIKHDKNDSFRFVSLQSDLGKKIITHIGIDLTKIDSLVLYEPGKAYYCKSQAVLRTANELGGIYRLLNLVAIFPTPFLNLVYDYIAKNRYRWFGKKESCRLPSPELLAKFLA
nr:DCC1-like thiol-disulfide oxidoreductase family protein [Flavobacterium phycosphaerae]